MDNSYVSSMSFDQDEVGVILTCSCVHNYASVTYSWAMDGTAVTSITNKWALNADSTELSIYNYPAWDGGYVCTCSATNPTKEVSSDSEAVEFWCK